MRLVLVVVVGFPGCSKYCSPGGFEDVPVVMELLLHRKQKEKYQRQYSISTGYRGGFEDVSLVKCSLNNFTSTLPIIWDAQCDIAIS